MTRKVLAIELDPTKNGPQVHPLPFGVKVVHVHRLDGSRFLTVNVEMNPDADTVGHLFWIIRTGDEIPHNGQHVGSYVSGLEEWHVYLSGRR
jgi:hypothetical protein